MITASSILYTGRIFYVWRQMVALLHGHSVAIPGKQRSTVIIITAFPMRQSSRWPLEKDSPLKIEKPSPEKCYRRLAIALHPHVTTGIFRPSAAPFELLNRRYRRRHRNSSGTNQTPFPLPKRSSPWQKRSRTSHLRVVLYKQGASIEHVLLTAGPSIPTLDQHVE